MHVFTLAADDTPEAFARGLDALGPIDIASEHANRYRHVIMLGQVQGWARIAGADRPAVIDWRARIVLPVALDGGPLAAEIISAVQNRLQAVRGRWLVDIRSEARRFPEADVGRLVRQDIDRGDLPNRLLFERGVQPSVKAQLGRLRHQVARKRSFDWRRVRIRLDAS